MRKNIPKLITLLVFASGFLNIASSLWGISIKRAKFLEEIIPVDITHASRTLTLIIGFFLLFLARGLWNQKRRAWALSFIGISISLVTHLLKGLNIEEVLVLFIPLAFLYFYRRDFRVRSGRTEGISSIKRSIAVICLLFIYAVFGFFALQGQFDKKVDLQNIRKDYEYKILGIGKQTLKPKTRNAIWFSNSISVIGFVAVISVIGALFAPFIEAGAPTDKEKEKARFLILNYGENATDYLALMDDKRYFFGKEGRNLLAYKIRSGAAVCLGDPIGEDNFTEKCGNDFVNSMHFNGLNVVFVNVKENKKNFYEKSGLKLIKFGEEAILKTKEFTLEGSKMKAVRNEVNKISRENITFKWFNLREIPGEVLVEVEKLHQKWLAEKKGPHLTFAVDFFPLPLEEKAYLITAYSQSNILLAAFDFFPYKEGKAMGLDLMLRNPAAPNGIAEATVSESMSFFKNLGVEEVSLGVALLSDNEGEDKEDVVNKTLKLIFGNLNQFYGFKSLFAFKEKFNPVWEHKYIAVKNYRELPRALVATLQAQIKKNS